MGDNDVRLYRGSGHELRIRRLGSGPSAALDIRVWRAEPGGQWRATDQGVELSDVECESLLTLLSDGPEPEELRDIPTRSAHDEAEDDVGEMSRGDLLESLRASLRDGGDDSGQLREVPSLATDIEAGDDMEEVSPVDPRREEAMKELESESAKRVDEVALEASHLGTPPTRKAAGAIKRPALDKPPPRRGE